MKTIYMIYLLIPYGADPKFYTDRVHHLGKTEKGDIYFYGFTDHKKYIKNFMRTRRSDIFFYSKHKINNSQYLTLTRKYFLHELIYNHFHRNEVMLAIEKKILSSNLNLTLCYFQKIRPLIFSEKYENALNSLYYKMEVDDSAKKSKLDIYYIFYNELLNDSFYDLIK